MSARPELCADCGAPFPVNPPGYTGGTGRARVGRNGPEVCYTCADARCLAEWNATRPGERFACYLAADACNVTTWPGGHLAKVFRVNRTKRYTPTGGQWEAWHIVARDASGRWWHGIGTGPGMLCTLTPCKGTKPPRIR